LTAMQLNDPSVYVSSIHVEESCLEHPYAREIIERSGLPVTVTGNEGPSVSGIYPHNLARGKQALFLSRNRGKFFKACPGTREYRCCGYHVLNIGMNCPMDCVYCILQAYLNNPWLSFFVNIDDLFAELDREFAANPGRLFRIGTGEFTDSLALDRLTGLSSRLVNYFRDRKNAVLELKTKSAVIDNLAGLEHNGRTVVAWSLNSPVIAAREELRTAALDERLAAAARCAGWGYRLAFHFDPIIHHQGWRQGYRQTIRRLFEAVPGEAIAWISLGALRFLPHLKPIAASRFPGSRFFYNEFIEGLDAKSRYFRARRTEMYRFIVEELHRYVSAETCLYFCMENDLIWQEVFGFIPEDKGGLTAMLDRAAGWR
jgi:spore photoproduct lyase